jgi:choline dehydrogenase-like flavoprotein
VFLDFRTVDDNALFEADLCIIGAGAAGITIARELAGSHIQVCLVEAGGLEFEPDVQDVYAGANIGHPYFDLDVARLRFFGGTTNHWTGQCAPLQPIDFRSRSWVAHSGWPITRQDLDPFYRRAQSICQLGPFAYGAEVWSQIGVEPHAFDPDEVELCFWQRSPPTNFGEAYRTDLERAANVRVLLHGNVTNIATDSSAAVVQHLDVRTLDGKNGRIRAKIYVLACGGIENARLLLLSDSVEPSPENSRRVGGRRPSR